MMVVCRFVAAAVLLAAVLPACTTPTSGTVAPVSGSVAPSISAPTAPESTASVPPSSAAKPPPRFAPLVREPKDARGIAPCDLLTVAQQVELGFRPETAEPGVAGPAQTCGWRTDRPGQPAAVQINTDPTIPALDIVYGIRDVYAIFEPSEIAGHPAVRADYNNDEGCVIYTAIADYQGMATGTDIGVGGQADPCAGSRRMAELILSNLPPLR